MKLKILSVKAKPFTTDDNEQMEYFWYRAIRLSDEVTFQFGSRNGGHVVGSELDLNIEKGEKASGKGYTYKEVLS